MLRILICIYILNKVYISKIKIIKYNLIKKNNSILINKDTNYIIHNYIFDAINFQSNKLINILNISEKLKLNKFKFISKNKYKINNLVINSIYKYNKNTKWLYDNKNKKYDKNNKNIVLINYFNRDNMIQKKYDIIVSNISCQILNSWINSFTNIHLFFNLFLFFILNLNVNGSASYFVGTINIKPFADILILAKKYFKEVKLLNSKLNTHYRTGGMTVIFKEFKGISKKDLNELWSIFDQLQKHDPTTCSFNIKDPKIRKKYGITKPITKESVFTYPEQFLDLPIDSPEYDFIREFNQEFYLQKIIFIKKMIENFHLYYGKNIPKSIREQQLIHSYAYAKEFNLKTIKFTTDFLKDFKTMIAEDIYKLYNGKTYEMVSSNNNYNELKNAKILIKDDITNLEEEYNALLNSYNNELKDLKDENLWIKYYELGEITDELKNKLEKHTTIKISDKHYQEWFKYYEVFIKFNSLINKTKISIKGLHLCEPTMVSVSALKYYNLIHNDNLLSYNWFIQNIDCKECNKNIYNKFHDKFVIKNFKNKNVINSLCKKVKDEKFNIIVSNCSEKENVKKLFLIIFSLLDKNGSCVIKYKYPVLYKNLYLLNLCYKHFRKVSFYKPVYSNNTEFFIICQKYNPISDKDLKKIKTNTYKPTFSNHFKVNIKDMIQNITNDIIFEISKGIFYLRNNNELPKQTNTFIKKIVNKKNDEWFKIFMPINLKSRKKVSFFDVSIFAELFTLDNPMKLKFSHSNSLNNFNYNYNNNNNNNTRISFNKLIKSYGKLDTLMDDKDKYPDTFYYKVIKQFEIFKDDRFKQQLKKDYRYNVTQGGMKMNEMLISFKDLLPKKKIIKTFHICEAPGSFIKMIKYYVKNVLKGKLEYNVTSLDPKHIDNLKKYGTGILDYNKNINRNRIHYGENKTGDITNLKNILSMKKYCEDVDLITSDCGLGEHIRDKFAEKILFYSSLFMLINVPEGKNCLLKFYLPIIKDTEISMIYTMYKYFKKVYMYKPIVNFRSGEFYLVCIGKKNVPEKIINDLSLKNPKFEKVTNASFLLQLYNFSKRIIDKRNLQLERILYLMDNYNLLTEKEFDLINKIKEKRINNWIKTNKL